MSFRFSVARSHVLNAAPDLPEVLRTLSADDIAIPLLYGQGPAGGRVYALDYTSGTWTVGYLFCLGEIGGFTSIEINDAAPLAGVTINYYTGTTSQGVDPLLAAAIADYQDDLIIASPAGNLGIVHVVIQYTDDHYDTWPKVVAQLQGKKVWNPDTSLTEYSPYPALHLADVLASPLYGHGYTVDDTSLLAALAANTDASLGEVRRKSFFYQTDAEETDTVIDRLRTYAGCFVAVRGNVAHLIPDRPVAVSKSLTAADCLRGSVSIRKRDSENLPTAVRIRYYDPVTKRERLSDPAYRPGVQTGLTELRLSVVKMNFVDRHSQAYREAVERLNKLWLSDLEVSLTAFDEAMDLEIGDVIELTHPLGLTAKPLRLMEDSVQVGPGRWRLTLVEYDPAAYSDAVVSQPTYADGNLPSGGVPSPPSNISVTETTYQLRNGEYASRLNITWDQPSSFVSSYTVTVRDGAQTVWVGTATATSIATSPLKELVYYTIEVRAQTPLYVSDPAEANFTIIGKTAIPDPPATVVGLEAGGEVRLSWSASTDVDAERYEVRYSTTAQTWDQAIVIDVVDGLRLVTRDVPPGTWRFHVKTIDSIFQYSTTAATVDLEVTLDDDAFTAGNLDPIEGTESTTHLHAVAESRVSGVTQYYTQSAQSWSTLFGAAAMNTFGNALVSYQTAPGTSELVTEELAFAGDRTGSFTAALPGITDHTGASTLQLGLKPDGGAYAFGNLSQKASARYAKLRVQSAGIVQLSLPKGYIRADVLAREEVGLSTSLVAGAKTITLDRVYAGARSLVITPESTSARVAVYDNIQLGSPSSFDVYIFDSNGNQVANNFRWQWKGV